jgi:hypothetical protein
MDTRQAEVNKLFKITNTKDPLLKRQIKKKMEEITEANVCRKFYHAEEKGLEGKEYFYALFDKDEEFKQKTEKYIKRRKAEREFDSLMNKNIESFEQNIITCINHMTSYPNKILERIEKIQDTKKSYDDVKNTGLEIKKMLEKKYSSNGILESKMESFNKDIDNQFNEFKREAEKVLKKNYKL